MEDGAYRRRVADQLQEPCFGSHDHKRKRSVMKPFDKSRFSSDWPLSEDTSTHNPSDIPFEAPLLFGRGFRAGFDRLDQKKKQLKADTTTSTMGTGLGTSSLLSHWSTKKLADMTPRDWRIFQEDFAISYKGSHVHRPRPMRDWEESGLSHAILRAVQQAGYKRPSAIQMAAIPIGLAHKDAIGVAETGSGKTASFVLPMLNHVSSLSPVRSVESEAHGPYALILAPTRELAQQIEVETLKLSCYLHNIAVVSIVGGHSIEQQGMRLSHGCDIVIATPGRLLDCLERKFVVLNQCNYVVLDEADRMVAMGFEEQLVRVLNALPVSTNDTTCHVKTMCMFSATMPSAVERIAQRFLRDPVIINVGTAGKAPDLVTQQVIMVKDSEKLQKLQGLLDAHNRERLIIVFVNTKDSAHILVRQLERRGYRAIAFHGSMVQKEREASLKGFKSRQYNCLVATDLAGRGIDIQGITHVVNYEMPHTIEKYTHRIGRTGRAGNKGFATTFLTLSDTRVFYDLKHLLIRSNCRVPLELARHKASQGTGWTNKKSIGTNKEAIAKEAGKCEKYDFLKIPLLLS